MHIIPAINVNDAYWRAMNSIEEWADFKPMPSRNGAVFRASMPVTTIYERPDQRVLFDEKRDANPFFHLLEALWMLAGRNDVKWISQFNSTFSQFSDDGATFNGAYGYRWRSYFQLDQIGVCINKLRANPMDRQVYIAMWDGYRDLTTKSKDIPCNLGIKFAVNNGKLDMMVTNRSNDLIWGAYGANVVHMSVLHEYVAAFSGLPLGRYYQISMDFHAYLNTYEKHRNIPRVAYPEPYALVNSSPLVDVEDTFDRELCFLLDETDWAANHPNSFSNGTLRTASIMIWVWRMHKAGASHTEKMYFVDTMPNADWRAACRQWLERRAK